MEHSKLREAAARFGTPLYLFDMDALQSRVQHFRSVFGPHTGLCYAVKANPFLPALFAGTADRFEVCSHGEYRLCRAQGVPDSSLLISGVNKARRETEEQMADAPEAGAWTAESVSQLQQLEEVAAVHGRTVRVLLRLESGSQFGMEQEEIEQFAAHRARYPHLEPVGLQLYGGTQRHSLKGFARDLTRLTDLYTLLSDRYGLKMEEIEYGPGFPVTYFPGENPPDEEAYLATCAELCAAAPDGARLTLEVGRWLAAPCGCYLTAVADVKKRGGQHYAILDGGIHHIAYYGQSLGMRIPPLVHLGADGPAGSDGPAEPWTLCGSLCTVNDVLVRQMPLSDVAPGDLFVFTQAGAYAVTEGISLFLSRDLPAVCACRGAEFTLLRQRTPTWVLNTPGSGIG